MTKDKTNLHTYEVQVVIKKTFCIDAEDIEEACANVECEVKGMGGLLDITKVTRMRKKICIKI